MATITLILSYACLAPLAVGLALGIAAMLKDYSHGNGERQDD